tara:strand:- start:150 stop:485 length:336 start_codon:yes stop_codon:yes gene_type:complete
MTTGAVLAGTGAGKGVGDNIRRNIFGIENAQKKEERQVAQFDRQTAADTASQERRFAHELAMADRGYGATGNFRRREQRSAQDTGGTGAGSKADRQGGYQDKWRSNRSRLS